MTSALKKLFFILIQLLSGRCESSIELTMKEEFLLEQFIFFPRHLQVFWNRSADLWQHLWDNFLDYAGNEIISHFKRRLITF